jgi:hypothetical protein
MCSLGDRVTDVRRDAGPEEFVSWGGFTAEMFVLAPTA